MLEFEKISFNKEWSNADVRRTSFSQFFSLRILRPLPYKNAQQDKACTVTVLLGSDDKSKDWRILNFLQDWTGFERIDKTCLLNRLINHRYALCHSMCRSSYEQIKPLPSVRGALNWSNRDFDSARKNGDQSVILPYQVTQLLLVIKQSITLINYKL